MYFHEGKGQPGRQTVSLEPARPRAVGEGLPSGRGCVPTWGNAFRHGGVPAPLRSCDQPATEKRIQRKYAMRGNLFAREDAKPPRTAPGSFAAEAEDVFREFVLRPVFPCVGAKAAFNSSSYTLRVFDELGSDAATRELSAALCDFTQSEMMHRERIRDVRRHLRGTTRNGRTPIRELALAAAPPAPSTGCRPLRLGPECPVRSFRSAFLLQLRRTGAVCDRPPRQQFARGAPISLAGPGLQPARTIRAAARGWEMEADAGDDSLHAIWSCRGRSTRC